jgi:hypothetical protein
VSVENNVSPQIGNYLPGMAPKAQGAKQPHQMSPEEFLDSPDIFFHATNRPVEQWKSKKNTQVHVGSYRAASERSMDVENTRAGFYATPSGPTTMIAGKISPKAKIDSRVYSDSEANIGHPAYNVAPFEGQIEPNFKKVVFYPNNAEDNSSLSAVLPNASLLKTHADYVTEAISKGKADEVHPKTMAMYKAGVLGAWKHDASSARGMVQARFQRHSQPEPLFDVEGAPKPAVEPNFTYKWNEGTPDWRATSSGVGIDNPREVATPHAESDLFFSDKYERFTGKKDPEEQR